MFRMKRLASVALAGCAALVTACSDSGPGSVDTQAMVTELDQLAVTFENNAAYQSMASLLGFFPGAAPAVAMRATLPTAGFSVLPLRTGRMALAAPRPELSPSDAALIIPVDIRGTTFAWNVDSAGYVASALTGAPAAGIRVLLYTINPTTGQPLLPLSELGSVDLIDESNASSDRLHVILRLGVSTISDYTITSIPGANSLTLTAAGYLRNATATERVDFTLESFDNYLTGGGDFEYTLTAQGGASVVVDIHDNGDESGTVAITVTHGGNSIALNVTETAVSSSGTVSFNGTVVANITQAGENPPVFTGAGGQELSQQQQADIVAVFGGAMFLVLITIFGIFMPAFLFI